MTCFGDKLRREREMRGVSLEEISESTKIGTRSLRALEEEDFEKLPGGIFNKGFVRAYSRFLGIDEEQAVADFDAAWKEHQAAKAPPPEIALESQSKAPESRRSGPLLIALLVLLAIAVAAYTFKYFRNPRPAQQELSGNSEQIARSNPVPPAPSASASDGIQAVTANPQTNSRPTQDSQTSSAESLSKDSAARDAEQPVGASAPATNAPIRLEVFAREDSWLSVLADGKNLWQGTLTAQKSRTIRATKEVRLRVGNVGGVEVSFNGKPVNIDGEPKQVKELTFTAEGLHQ